jgi:hypothetical protein
MNAALLREAAYHLRGTDCPLSLPEALDVAAVELESAERVRVLREALEEISESDPDESTGRLRDIANDALQATAQGGE